MAPQWLAANTELWQSSRGSTYYTSSYLLRINLNLKFKRGVAFTGFVGSNCNIVKRNSAHKGGWWRGV